MAEAVVTTSATGGNRTDRKNAKTKYTLERVGVETFKAEVERRAGIKFEPIRPYEFTGLRRSYWLGLRALMITGT